MSKKQFEKEQQSYPYSPLEEKGMKQNLELILMIKHTICLQIILVAEPLKK